jgi:replication factor A1
MVHCVGRVNATNFVRILIILDMEVLKQFGVRDKIGNPVGLENLQASTPAVAPQDGMSAGSFYGNKPAAAPSHPPAERGGGAGTSGTS